MAERGWERGYWGGEGGSPGSRDRRGERHRLIWGDDKWAVVVVVAFPAVHSDSMAQAEMTKWQQRAVEEVAVLEEAVKNNTAAYTGGTGRCTVREQYAYLQQPPDFSQPAAMSIDRRLFLAERRLGRELPVVWKDKAKQFKLTQHVVHLRSIKRDVCAIEIQGCCLADFFTQCVLDEVDVTNTLLDKPVCCSAGRNDVSPSCVCGRRAWLLAVT